MPLFRHADLGALLFVLLACAAFGALFAWALAIPFWLGMAMVGAAVVAAGLNPPASRGRRGRRQPA